MHKNLKEDAKSLSISVLIFYKIKNNMQTRSENIPHISENQTLVGDEEG